MPTRRREPPLGDLSPAARRRGLRRRDRRLRRRRRGRGGGRSPRRARRRRARGGPHTWTAARYPEDPLEALAALYRDNGLTVAEGRPAIPTPIGRAVGGTTVINSGTCFRAPDAVLAGWRDEHGIEWATDLDPEYAEAEEMLDVTPGGRRADGPQRPARAWRAPRRSALSHGRCRRNAGRCVQCSSCPPAAGSTPSGPCTSPTCPAPSRPAPGSARASSARRVRFEGGARAGLDCVATARDGDGAGALPRSAPGARGPRRRRDRHAGAAAALGVPLARAAQLGRNLRIHPAGWVGARFDEEVRGWDGVMQSYGVDEWEERGLLLEATFTPLAFGAQWLPGTGARAPGAGAGLRPPRLERGPPLRSLVGPGGPRRRRLAADHLPAQPRGRRASSSSGSPARPRSSSPPARPRSTRRSRHADASDAAGRRLRGLAAAARRAAARGVPPDGDRAHGRRSRPRASSAPTAPCTAPTASTSPTAACCPSSLGVNPMMTIIAMALARIARQLAERLACRNDDGRPKAAVALNLSSLGRESAGDLR